MKRKKKTIRKKLKLVVLSRKQLNAEIARLEQKCHERSNECYLLKVQKDALEMKLLALREAYNSFDSAFNRTIRA